MKRYPGLGIVFAVSLVLYGLLLCALFASSASAQSPILTTGTCVLPVTGNAGLINCTQANTSTPQLVDAFNAAFEMAADEYVASSGCEPAGNPYYCPKPYFGPWKYKASASVDVVSVTMKGSRTSIPWQGYYAGPDGTYGLSGSDGPHTSGGVLQWEAATEGAYQLTGAGNIGTSGNYGVSAWGKRRTVSVTVFGS